MSHSEQLPRDRPCLQRPKSILCFAMNEVQLRPVDRQKLPVGIVELADLLLS